MTIMMKKDQALVSQLANEWGNSGLLNLCIVFVGVVLLSALAQIAIPLPFTPVPITGQTFGVALLSLLWGRHRGFATVASYLGIGAMGIPVFASGAAGLTLGPTSGYLFGMLLASWLMGALADRGWTKTFLKSWLAVFFGSLCTFACGLLILSLFVTHESLLSAGLLPFLPGDAMKSLLAADLANKVSSK